MNHPYSFDPFGMHTPGGEILSEKQCFSRIGGAYAVMYGLSLVLPILVLGIMALLRSSLPADSTFQTAISMAMMYLVAAPVTVMLLRRVPARAPQPGRMDARMFVACLLVGISLMAIGSYLGENVMQAINATFGTHSVNGLDTLEQDSGPIIWGVLILIAAPAVEELLFRKLLLDRVRQFGEVPAVLLSGLLFGLFHGNLYQFFYAAALGFVLAYVYLRTGKLRWCVLLHLCFNITGGLLFPMLADPSGWLPAFPGSSLVATGITGLYIAAILACIVCSAVLLAKHWRSIELRGPECRLQEGYLRTIVGNSGMITFLVLMIVIFMLDIVL